MKAEKQGQQAQRSKTVLQQLPPPKPPACADRFELLTYRFSCALVKARNELAAENEELRNRLVTVEAQATALAPLVESDRLEVARVCQALSVKPETLQARGSHPGRAEAANKVFRALRAKGWSVDRIAKATSYGVRGVQLNLARFQTSLSRVTLL
jgi:hypothetical protein